MLYPQQGYLPLNKQKLIPKTAPSVVFPLDAAAMVLPLLMVLPHWGEKQSHQGARAAPLSLVGLSYSSGQSLQHHTQRNRTGDWQGTGDSVCMFDTDGPSAGASETKWPTSRFRYLTFPAENMMWMVWNNPKTPASLSVPRTLG